MEKLNQSIIPGPLYPDLFNGLSPIMQTGEAMCLGCGCTDSHACADSRGPCHWLHVDYDEGVGACSNCEEYTDMSNDWGRIEAKSKQMYCRRHQKVKKVRGTVHTFLGLVNIYRCLYCKEDAFT